MAGGGIKSERQELLVKKKRQDAYSVRTNFSVISDPRVPVLESSTGMLFSEHLPMPQELDNACKYFRNFLISEAPTNNMNMGVCSIP